MEPSWRNLLEFVHDLLDTPGSDIAVPTLLGQLERLVPADCGVALFKVSDGLPFCIHYPVYAARVVSDFNTHFNRSCPVRPPKPGSIMGPVDWACYSDTEYHREFNQPLHIRHSVGFRFSDRLDADDLVIVFNRSAGPAAAFREDEVRAIRLCVESFQRIRTLHRQASGICRDWVSRPEVEGNHRPLSHREAEVAVLLQRRISMREISEILGISLRTVERHVLHIYEKLDVSTRREFLHLCGVPDSCRE